MFRRGCFSGRLQNLLASAEVNVELLELGLVQCHIVSITDILKVLCDFHLSLCRVLTSRTVSLGSGLSEVGMFTQRVKACRMRDRVWA